MDTMKLFIWILHYKLIIKSLDETSAYYFN